MGGDDAGVCPSLIDQVDFLADGRVDVAFVRLPLADDTFTVLPLLPEPRVAAVPARMVALAYLQHRTMPELKQFAELATWMLTGGPAPEPGV
jgi:hypothetical protein